MTDPILVRAINKSYIVQPGQLVEGNLSTEEGCDEFAKSVYEGISKQQQEGNVESNVSLRMKIFPPKYQSKLLTSFDALIEQAEKNSTTATAATTDSTSINIDPKDFTHMLSIVEIYQYKGRGWEQNDVKSNNLYMWGLSEASLDEDVVDANNLIALDGNLVDSSNNNNDGKSSDDGEVEVGRAYYKLKEAIETYKSSSSNNEEGENKLYSDLYDESVVALDCGSAPGGWTKYLIEHFNCKTVYSIDPGKLAKSVSQLEQTKHIQMKIQDAIPLLLKEEDTKVKIWVSDMCLHDMESQVDLLLMAKDSGLLASNCFVVLTLKCIVGHSKSAYDAQVKKVVDKLCDKASMECVEIFHLFSNRSGERTVMGYLK